MRSRIHLISFVLIALLAVPVGYAQSASTTGSLRGTVTDADGQALPGVTVTVSNQGTGLTRTLISDSNGMYSAELLPPGTYRVRGELSGFGNATRENVAVSLGSSTNVALKITPQISEEITVTASAPVVDTTQSGTVSAVSAQQIENLPLLGRDFTDLVKLTPGVGDTFNDGVSLNGGRGVTASFNIDGAETNSDFFGQQRGGSRPPFTFSQAAIQEFQVIRTSYSAEYSRGVGGTLNAITKSGTNDLKGQVFYFFRDGGWAADRSLAINGQPIDENFLGKDSSQYGFSFGGPITRDKFHYFVNTDFQDIAEPVSTGDVRLRSGFLALPAATQAAFIADVERLLGYSFDEELSYDSTEDMQTFLVKFDANLAANHHLSFRDNYSKFENQNNQSASNTVSHQGIETDKFNQAVVQMTSILSSSTFNDLLVQFGKEERPITPTNNTLPDINISGPAPFRFGRVDFLPNNTVEEKWQIKDNFSYLINNHELRAGIEILLAEYDNFFVRDTFGEYQFTSIANYLARKPSFFQQGASPGDGHNVFGGDTYGVFFQDTMTMNRLTIDAGIRYDVTKIDKPEANITGYPELVSNFEDDKNNFAPRVGFAYDFRGDGRSVLRGGIGLFYSPVTSILFANPIANIEGITYNINVNCTTAPANCGTFPNLLPAATVIGLPPASRDLAAIGPDLEAQESTRTSIGYENQVGDAYSFGIEGTYAKLEKQQRFANLNAVPTGQSYGNLVLYSVGGPNSRFPNYANVRMHLSDAEGEYKALTLSAAKRAVSGSNFSWLAHYTWSESIDMDSNERSTSTSFNVDPYNPKLSEGPADYNAKHRVVISGSYELPFGINVGAIFNWRTGYPYSREIAGLNNGANVFGVNTLAFVDSSGNLIDMTKANGMTSAELSAFLSGAVMGERGSETQPDFMNLDLRLSRSFALMASGLRLELIGEVFNAMNETNERFSGSSGGNRIVYNTAVSGGKFTFTPTTAFGQANSFTGTPRQYQVAAKIIF